MEFTDRIIDFNAISSTCFGWIERVVNTIHRVVQWLDVSSLNKVSW